MTGNHGLLVLLAQEVHTISLSKDVLPWAGLGIYGVIALVIGVATLFLPLFVWGCYRELKRIRRLLSEQRRPPASGGQVRFVPGGE